MIITCENCSTRFELDDSLIKPQGSKVRCSLCRHIFLAMPQKPEPESPAVPDKDPSQAPLPTETDQEPPDDASLFPFDFGPQDQEDFKESEPAFQDLEEDLEETVLDDGQDFDAPGFELEETATQDLEAVPELDLPDLDTPQVDFSEPESPELDAQGLDSPELDSPEMDVPEFETPEFDTPELDLPGLDVPELEAAELELEESGPGPADNGLELEGLEMEGSVETEDTLDIEPMEFEDLEFEDGPPTLDSESTADIEISFDENDTAQDIAFELEEEPLEEIEFDEPELTLEADGLEFDADLEPDLEPDFKPAGLEPELELDFGDSGTRDELETPIMPEATLDEAEPPQEEAMELVMDDGFPAGLSPEPESLGDETKDQESPGLTLDEQKFAQYDQVLSQQTEPEDLSPEPEEEDEEEEIEEDIAPDTKAQPEAAPPRTLAAAEPDPIALTPLIEPDRTRAERRRKKSGLGGPVKLLALIFFLVIAAYLIVLRLGIDIPFLTQIEVPFVTQAFKPAPQVKPALGPIPNDASTKGRFVTNDSAGRLFIVTGRIDNPDTTPYSHIKVRGTLITKDNAKAATQSVYCGNIIAEEALKSGNITDITQQLMKMEGIQNTNINIAPGGSVQFMLVFSNLPENLTNFTVEVEEFKAAGAQ